MLNVHVCELLAPFTKPLLCNHCLSVGSHLENAEHDTLQAVAFMLLIVQTHV